MTKKEKYALARIIVRLTYTTYDGNPQISGVVKDDSYKLYDFFNHDNSGYSDIEKIRLFKKFNELFKLIKSEYLYNYSKLKKYYINQFGEKTFLEFMTYMDKYLSEKNYLNKKNIYIET